MVKLVHKEYLGKEFAYNPDSGILYGLHRGGRGWLQVGTVDNAGYLQVRVDKKNIVFAHRLIWWLMYNEWPNIVDHIDQDKQNNRLVNLRNVTQTENQFNRPKQSHNTSGVTGVSQAQGYWIAKIVYKNKQIVKYCKTKDEAIKARKQLEIDYGIA